VIVGLLVGLRLKKKQAGFTPKGETGR